VRVCIWPDYYGVTTATRARSSSPASTSTCRRTRARPAGAKVQHVDSSFATLVDDLKSDRCDVAMFAVGMLPQRMQHLRFTRPYLQSDIYGVTTKSNRAVQPLGRHRQARRAGGVQAGTFMEPVMRGSSSRPAWWWCSRRPRANASWRPAASTCS
jgi:cyclohexadienyl dehydratase